MQSDYYQGAPIYLQILHNIRQRIASGEWPPGMRIPPVRELSMAFEVNPNTAQRSLAELEREGLVYTERTTGRYITTDTERIAAMREQMASDFALQYFGRMRAVGYNLDDMVRILHQTAHQEEGGKAGPQ